MKIPLNAANVLASIAGTVAAETAAGGVGTAISGAMSLNELLQRFLGKTPGINARIGSDLQAELDRQHLTPDQRLLIAQMIEKAPLSPSEVVAAARRPDRICSAMLEKMTDPAHRNPILQDAFSRVVTAVLTRLLADTAMSDTLRPAFEDAVAESLAFIGEQVERLMAQSHDTAYRLGVQETLVRELARRYAPGSEGDFETACRGLEAALDTAAAMQKAARLPQNTSDQVDAVLAEVAALNRDGRLEEGAAALARARVAARERIAQEAAGLARLLDEAVGQARIMNRPEAAAEALVERLMLDTPADPFGALRALQGEWHERGRDKGLVFDLNVSIALARHNNALARSPDQRGTALNDLGVSLAILGQREPGTARLEDAVAAHEDALKERTRDRVPLDWAMTQNNLGNALAALGQREAGTARLEQAVAAYEEALKERTLDRVPLDWAATQNNLGTALQTIGEREAGTARLEAAVAAYEEALKERTSDRVPLDWAMTQNNLGTVLQTLGQREAGTARLEQAVAAYEEALKEYTRDRVPLDWAATQNNLGTALQTIGEREAGTARLEAAVAAYEEALKERTSDRVPLDWAMTQNNLGNSLRILGAREASTARLDAAVAAFEEALKERTRDRVPLDWAMTQNNLGNALAALGEREAGTARLEAGVAAYAEALKEYTRDRVPLDWASTQLNLSVVGIAFFDKTGDRARLAEARARALAAREVFVAAGAGRYVERADATLANIARREAP